MHPEVQPLLERPERRTGLLFLVLMLVLAGVLAFALVYYGSLDLWKGQFHAGTVQERTDYDEERWSRNFERYPFLRQMFLPGGGR